MGIAWKVLLPLVLINILITAFIRLMGNGQLTSRTAGGASRPMSWNASSSTYWPSFRCWPLSAWSSVKNPVHSAIFLVLTLFNTAGIFVMLGAEFLAAAQVIVYAGAVLVLMLFFLMLVDPQKLSRAWGGHPCNAIVGPLLGIILFLEVAAAIANRAMIG